MDGSRMSWLVMRSDSSIQLIAFDLQLQAGMGPNGDPEPHLLRLRRGGSNSQVMAAFRVRELGESPDELEEQFWMLTDVERLCHNATGAVPPEDPCEGTSHIN